MKISLQGASQVCLHHISVCPPSPLNAHTLPVFPQSVMFLSFFIHPSSAPPFPAIKHRLSQNTLKAHCASLFDPICLFCSLSHKYQNKLSAHLQSELHQSLQPAVASAPILHTNAKKRLSIHPEAYCFPFPDPIYPGPPLTADSQHTSKAYC